MIYYSPQKGGFLKSIYSTLLSAAPQISRYCYMLGSNPMLSIILFFFYFSLLWPQDTRRPRIRNGTVLLLQLYNLLIIKQQKINFLYIGKDFKEYSTYQRTMQEGMSCSAITVCRRYAKNTVFVIFFYGKSTFLIQKQEKLCHLTLIKLS